MLFLFLMITLMADAARVIEMRLQAMVLGRSTLEEMFLMVTEKVEAMEQAKSIIKLPKGRRLQCCAVIQLEKIAHNR
jgi:hypothetical protein